MQANSHFEVKAETENLSAERGQISAPRELSWILRHLCTRITQPSDLRSYFKQLKPRARLILKLAVTSNVFIELINADQGNSAIYGKHDHRPPNTVIVCLIPIGRGYFSASFCALL
jgi:hypothetical protein